MMMDREFEMIDDLPVDKKGAHGNAEPPNLLEGLMRRWYIILVVVLFYLPGTAPLL